MKTSKAIHEEKKRILSLQDSLTAKNRGKHTVAAIKFLTVNPELWKDRPRGDSEAERKYMLQIVVKLRTEGFTEFGDYASLTGLLNEARGRLSFSRYTSAELT